MDADAGRRIVWLESTDSTMREAARLADEGCASGTVVGAEEQTAGIGRHERKWLSAKGEGLYFTIVLRLMVPFDDLPVATMALGVAVAEAIEGVTGLRPDLRWPNDVLIGNKKVCGILVQLHDGALLAGIGINVNQVGFPPEVAGIATSLRLATGREVSRQALLNSVLGHVDRWLAALEIEGREAVFAAFAAASSYVAGKRVIVEQAEGEYLRGVTAGLTAEGFLQVRDDVGRIHVILAGGVRPDESDASRTGCRKHKHHDRSV